MEGGSRPSARAYIRSRQVQKSSSGCSGSPRSTRPRSPRWRRARRGGGRVEAYASPFEHGHLDTEPAGGLAGGLVAGVGVADDAYGRVVGEDALQAGRAFLGAVGEDPGPGLEGLADPDAAAVVDRDPARPTRGI